MPSYLAVLANRDLDAIANSDTRRRLQIGLENIPLTQRAAVTIANAGPDDPFRQAFVRINMQRGLYREATNGITFLAPLLFRADIALPAGVTTGNYEVDVKLFADGAMVARAPSAFEVVQSRLRAIRQLERTHARPVVRAGHRHDDAGHRLARLGDLPAGLDSQVNRPGSAAPRSR